MEVDLALLADAATIDASGKLNILGIFDHITTTSFPARHPKMVLVLRFSAGLDEAGQHHVEIALRDPDGNEVVHIDGEMQLGPGRGGAAQGIQVPHVLHMDGLVLPVPGQYGFDVTVDGVHCETVPLRVTSLAGSTPIAQA
ncbi:MAG: hypothetical protein OEZ65_13335 [Gemmatimonadota bacterium]|nr:hypothetical protein [Gemmatimonadota bacterium]MDH5760566.1 hypothetical protein [Gemmatimonadota bacterium]